jgi:DNA-directed RNA polymerase specialized sigma subunit
VIELSELRELRLKYRQDREDYERIRAEMGAAPGVRFDQIRSGHDYGSRIERLYIQADEALAKSLEAFGRWLDAVEQATERIEQLPNEDHKDILQERYILCHKWQQIADDRGVSLRRVYRMHQDALAAYYGDA